MFMVDTVDGCEILYHQLGRLKPYTGINHSFKLVQDFFHPQYLWFMAVVHGMLLNQHVTGGHHPSLSIFIQLIHAYATFHIYVGLS